MRRWMLIALLVLAATALATVALAQEPAATPEPAAEPSPAETQAEDATSVLTGTEVLTVTEVVTVAEAAAGTETVTVVRSLLLPNPDVSLMRLDLSAGFPLDPFFVSVNGGGRLAASSLDPSCAGYINEAPILTVNWSGEADYVDVFFYSDHDSTLVIGLPDGSYACNDNAGEIVFDAASTLARPIPGPYRIWVGSKRPLDLIPGVLVLTTKSAYNVGSFDLGGFVQREPTPTRLASMAELLPESRVLQEGLQSALAEATNVVPLTAGESITASVQLTGIIPGFLLPTAGESPEPVCSGLIRRTAQLIFSVEEGAEGVSVYFEGDGDATLALLGPDGLSYCSDDSAGDTNLNPEIDLQELEPGNYAVIVGRLAANKQLNGIVTVTTDIEDAPEMLAAPAQEGQP